MYILAWNEINGIKKLKLKLKKLKNIKKLSNRCYIICAISNTKSVVPVIKLKFKTLLKKFTEYLSIETTDQSSIDSLPKYTYLICKKKTI